MEGPALCNFWRTRQRTMDGEKVLDGFSFIYQIQGLVWYKLSTYQHLSRITNALSLLLLNDNVTIGRTILLSCGYGKSWVAVYFAKKSIKLYVCEIFIHKHKYVKSWSCTEKSRCPTFWRDNLRVLLRIVKRALSLSVGCALLVMLSSVKAWTDD